MTPPANATAGHSAPIVLLKGDDPVLMSDALTRLVDELVGGEDRMLLVEEFGAGSYGDDSPSLVPLVDAAQTPPFLTDRRIVVGRHAGIFSTKESVAPLVHALEDPLPTTVIVLVWEREPGSTGRLAAIPRSLLDAIVACGGVIVDAAAGKGKARIEWIDEQLAASSVSFDAAARRRLAEHLGDTPSMLPGLLATLEGVFGPGAALGVEDLGPYLGDAGDVAPWDLTDAIDDGDVTRALSMLDRMMRTGERHPLQIIAVLTSHYLRLLRLDDPEVRGEKAAAAALGLKGNSTFMAKKSLATATRLGPGKVREFVELLAQADLDLRGARAWPPETVMEVVVARLAGRSRRAGRRAVPATRQP